jgi:hypothetical protein
MAAAGEQTNARVHFAVSKNISRNREEAAAALQEGSSTNRQAPESKWRARNDSNVRPSDS